MNNKLLLVTYTQSEKQDLFYHPVEVVLLGMRDIIRFLSKKETCKNPRESNT